MNVSVVEVNRVKGRVSKEDGFLSMRVGEGKEKFGLCYIGYEDVVKEVDLSWN